MHKTQREMWYNGINSIYHQRFLKKIEKVKNGCWNWKAGTCGISGYGQFYYNKKNGRAHRYSYEVYKGEIPKGMLVCHTCDNPMCVNPKHLFLGTQKDNMQDASRKGRLVGNGGFKEGEKHWNSKLKEKDIVKMRKIYKPFSREFGVRAIARMFGVSNPVISYAIRGMTWKHVK